MVEKIDLKDAEEFETQLNMGSLFVFFVLLSLLIACWKYIIWG
jgi:hypothetical protein